MSGTSRLRRWLGGLAFLGRNRKAAIDDATSLLEAYGSHAYPEARSRARNARNDRWAEGDRHWSRVARVIAKAEGREIGLQTADRYGS